MTNNRVDARMPGYELLISLQASLSDRPRLIGSKGTCRFCGETNSQAFRQRAHLIPEALGNKWLFAQDECDICNKLFGIYDQALADAMGAVLTIGGTRGKGNKVRKTGRSGGVNTLRRNHDNDGKPQISAMSGNADFSQAIKRDPVTGRFQVTMPLPSTPFRPRHAYKSLCKMGLALMPKEELQHFGKLLNWLQIPDDSEPFSNLSVGLAFGLVGNAPQVASVTLMRRLRADNPTPYMYFTLSIGSVCCTIDLMPDTLDDIMPPVTDYSINTEWRTVLGDEAGIPQIVIEYTNPVTLNWASKETEPQPIESFTLDFDPHTTRGNFKPNFRHSKSV